MNVAHITEDTLWRDMNEPARVAVALWVQGPLSVRLNTEP
jgi:hypothetical protein